LIKLAKAKPGQLNYSATSAGSTSMLTAEMFKASAHVNIVHVPYKSIAAALTDVIAGQVDLALSVTPSALAQIKSQRVRALAVSTASRTSVLPEVPTVASQGFPGFEAKEWYGLVAPGGTPRAIVTRLNQEIVRIINSPDVRSRLLDLGTDIVGDSPDQFGGVIKAELAKWSKLLKETGIRLE